VHVVELRAASWSFIELRRASSSFVELRVSLVASSTASDAGTPSMSARGNYSG
jgi:hypothetical protein